MKLQPRPVSRSDIGALLEWRSTPDDLGLQLSQRLIAPKEHERWFLSRSSEIDRLPFLAYESDQDVFAYARVEPYQLGLSISILVNPKSRGKGVGKVVLTDFITRISSRFPNTPLYAIIHQKNLPSQRIFVGCGFKIKQNLENEFDEYLL